jgi:hypothetical protein
VSGASRFTLVFSTTDFYGNLVTLSGDTWNTHIVVDHPDMAGCENLVQETVQDPHEIRVSTLSDTGVVFVSSSGVGPRPEGIRVLVDYADAFYEKGASSGRIVTAYPIDIVKYSRPNIGRLIHKKGGRK